MVKLKDISVEYIKSKKEIEHQSIISEKFNQGIEIKLKRLCSLYEKICDDYDKMDRMRFANPIDNKFNWDTLNLLKSYKLELRNWLIEKFGDEEMKL